MHHTSPKKCESESFSGAPWAATAKRGLCCCNLHQQRFSLSWWHHHQPLISSNDSICEFRHESGPKNLGQKGNVEQRLKQTGANTLQWVFSVRPVCLFLVGSRPKWTRTLSGKGGMGISTGCTFGSNKLDFFRDSLMFDCDGMRRICLEWEYFNSSTL